MLIGQYVAEHRQNVTTEDLQYYIDESLLKSCMTPLGTETGDTQLLEELLGETMIYVMGQGINRKQRRRG